MQAEHEPRAAGPDSLTDGERWTREALLDLRQAGYSPGAWCEFIRRSLTRALETRRARPSLARQSRAWWAAGALAWVAICRLVRHRRDLSPSLAAGLAWWASVWKMLDWHLGMCEGVEGTPRERLSPADAVTLARFWLVPLIPAVRATRHGLVAIIILGGGSDWLDGALGRAAGETRLGRDLDATADLAFLTMAAANVARIGLLPRPGTYALASRYLVGTAFELYETFGLATRPAARARRWGGALRVGGLAVAAAGFRRVGGTILTAGCVVPPRAANEIPPADRPGAATDSIDESRRTLVRSHRHEQ